MKRERLQAAISLFLCSLVIGLFLPGALAFVRLPNFDAVSEDIWQRCQGADCVGSGARDIERDEGIW